MATRYADIPERWIRFISEQKIFFVGTAADEGRVNLSPKGMDCLRVIDANRVAWLSVTGSGNETAAHLLANPRMTLMFCAFDGPPAILRLYGNARAVHRNDTDWPALSSLFRPLPGARQVFDLSVDLVQTSCGFGVPNFDYKGDREVLNDWADKKGEDGIRAYWEQKNQHSIDGMPTHILTKNS